MGKKSCSLWAKIYCEPFRDRVWVSGRFRVLAAGECGIRDASALLFEPGVCGLSGGQTTGRVQGAPGACTRQGNRCAAPASAQPGDPNPVPERRLHRDSLPQPASSKTIAQKKKAPPKKGGHFFKQAELYSALLAVFLAAVFFAAVFLAAVFFTAVFLAAALVAVFLAADLRPGFSGRGSNSKPILPSA